MKKSLLIILSSFAIFSLISCNQPKPVDRGSSSHPILITTSKDDTSSNNPVIGSSEDIVVSGSDVSSSSEEETYYHVTFVNYDESILYEVDVLEGNEALYCGEDPVKEEDDEFTYTFIGWDIDLKSINSDVTAVAQFEAVAKENWGPIIWF